MSHRDTSADSGLAIQSVELRALNIERQVRFYHDMLGLYVRLRPAGRVELAADYDGPGIIALQGESSRMLPGDLQVPGHRLGLHCPSIDVLATCTARLIRHGVPVETVDDERHDVVVSFGDAEQNVVEISARKNESSQSEFDLNELLSRELLTSVPVIDGLRIGRLTLHSPDPPMTGEFYRDVLGVYVDSGADRRSHSIGQGVAQVVILRSEAEAISGRDDSYLGLSRMRLSAPESSANKIYDRACEFGTRVFGTPNEFTLVDPVGMYVDVRATGS